MQPEALFFLVPDWGIKPAMASKNTAKNGGEFGTGSQML